MNSFRNRNSQAQLEQAVTKSLFTIGEIASRVRGMNERTQGQYSDMLGRLYQMDAELRAALAAPEPDDSDEYRKQLAEEARINELEMWRGPRPDFKY